MYHTRLFTLKAKSNLHAGSGDANYGVIDNLIQRDAITDLPHINSSSLKGALREFAEYRTNPADVRLVFGSDPKESGDKAKAGYARFFEAKLLALPVRGDKKPYFMATSPSRISEFIDDCLLFGCTLDAALLAELNKLLNYQIEPNKAMTLSGMGMVDTLESVDLKGINAKALAPLFDDSLALLSEGDLKEIAASLPVIARNQLENGISQNLFYEEVLPRETLLYTFISFPGEKIVSSEDREGFEKAESHFVKAIEEEPVQIGANASIGYGLCQMKAL